MHNILRSQHAPTVTSVNERKDTYKKQKKMRLNKKKPKIKNKNKKKLSR